MNLIFYREHCCTCVTNIGIVSIALAAGSTLLFLSLQPATNNARTDNIRMEYFILNQYKYVDKGTKKHR